jgi:hypothetical protein
MKTFTVPIFLGVNADDKFFAKVKALMVMEGVMSNLDPETFPYCDVGLDAEIIEQEIQP